MSQQNLCGAIDAAGARGPKKDDVVRIKGTNIIGEVGQVNRVGLAGEIQSVTLHGQGTNSIRRPFYIVPAELVEIVEDADINKAAAALAGTAVVGTSLPERRAMVRTVLKVMVPDHPALRGQ